MEIVEAFSWVKDTSTNPPGLANPRWGLVEIAYKVATGRYSFEF
jgi:hypothetical protein